MPDMERPTIGPRFILKPDWDEMPQPRRVMSGLAKLLGIGFLGSVIAWQIFSALSEAAGYENILESELEQWSAIEQLILVVLIAPLLEETIYRLPLQRRFHPTLISISLLAGALFFTTVGSAIFWLVFPARGENRAAVLCKADVLSLDAKTTAATDASSSEAV